MSINNHYFHSTAALLVPVDEEYSSDTHQVTLMCSSKDFTFASNIWILERCSHFSHYQKGTFYHLCIPQCVVTTDMPQNMRHAYKWILI